MWMGLFVIGALLISGCASTTGTGALTGGALGLGLGSAVGGERGAIVGMTTGAVVGGVLGQAAQKNEKEKSRRKHLASQTRGLTINEVIQLSDAGVSPHKIMRLIEKTGSSYRLNEHQLTKLFDAGVSQQVIDYMLYET